MDWFEVRRMRSIHLLGLGLVAGLLAVGAVGAFAALRWSELAYPEASAPGPQQPAGQTAQAASPDVTQGEAIFKQKCSSCHTIGGGKSAGPDLKGVTSQRPNDWLISFITAPDKAIASGDPTAAQLVKEYTVPMPNLGVTTQQAGQILAYIQAQSGGGAPAPAAAAPAAPAAATAPATTSAPAAAATGDPT